MQYTMDLVGRPNAAAKDRVFGKRIGWIGRLFGCHHSDLSRPFTKGGFSYRACLSCGARKRFDTDTLTTHRNFYYPPGV